MTQKHTPRPWLMNTTKRFIHNKGLAITDSNNRLIAEVMHTSGEIPIDEYQANAKLIAAAPELLENLIRIIDRIEESDMQHNFPISYNRCKEAIKKATE